MGKSPTPIRCRCVTATGTYLDRQVSIIGCVRGNEYGLSSERIFHEGQARLIGSDTTGARCAGNTVTGYVTRHDSDPLSVPVRDPEVTADIRFSYAIPWLALTPVGVIGIMVLVGGLLWDQKKAFARRQPRERSAAEFLGRAAAPRPEIPAP